jgi:arylsulfatase A
MHFPGSEVTIAELLQQAGYRTGHFGKWHLSRLGSDQPQPRDQGFDYSLGTDNNASPSHRNPTNFVRNGEPVGRLEGYSCHIVAEETGRWIEEQRSTRESDPFFACVWFHEPHTPIASPPELVRKYQKKYPELSQREATYYANIENVDLAIGRLVDNMKDQELLDDTLIFFTSDNGPLNRFSRQGLRGQKSNVWEGGHRVPGVFRWPERIAAGSECEVPICGIDYLPTVCDLLDLPLPDDRPIDGTSILPLLEGKGDQFQRDTPLYWFFYRLNPAVAMRDGAWALVANTNDADRPKTHPLVREDMPHIRQSRPEEFQLFNLQDDLGQQHDLAEAEPERLESMVRRLEELHREVVTKGPQWDIPADYRQDAGKRIWRSE